MPIDARVEAATRLIEAAALNPERWDEALRAIAAATGSRIGQLCAFGSPATLSFNRLPDFDPEHLAEWAAQSFDHPAINSRIRVGMQAPLLQSLDESAFNTEQDALYHPEYGEAIRKFDIPYICAVNIIRQFDTHIGLAVLRGERQGNIDDEQRRAFDHLARHAERAIRASLAISSREASAIALGMDAIGVTAFICDARGEVVAMSRDAEDMLHTDRRLSLTNGRLFERVRGRDLSLLACAEYSRELPPMPPLIIEGDDQAFPLIAEFAPLPADTPGFPGRPGMIILLRQAWARIGSRIERQALLLYELTPREKQVAVGLCAGRSPQQLAIELSLGLATIRTHIRRLFDKTHATNLAQLVAILSAYDG